MPKQKKKSNQVPPFSMYLRAFKRRNRYMSEKEAIDRAKEDWTQMDDHERETYKALAEIEKRKRKENLAEKKDCHGVSLLFLKNMQEEKERMEEKRKERAEQIVASSLNGVGYDKQEYIFGDFTAHAFDGVVAESSAHFPAEFALVKFNVQDGLLTKFAHAIINPGDLDKLKGDAADAFKDTGIEILNDKDWMSTDYSRMARDIRSFTSADENRDLKADQPIFIRRKALDTTLGCLNFIFSNSEYEVKDLPEILYVEDLHESLRDHVEAFCASRNVVCKTFLNSLGAILKILNTSCYDFSPGIACELHQDTPRERPDLCCLGKCRRWAFLMLKDICSHAQIDLRRGVHYPESYPVDL